MKWRMLFAVLLIYLKWNRQIQRAAGLDNLLYSADADFSCFADLALTSPEDYYKPGEGSLIQYVPSSTISLFISITYRSLTALVVSMSVLMH